ncbi:Nudix hydrolase 20 chloroplastic [Fasciolopsis buskii]|uniref:Nudix hydrolase 20 chloroplastic n=1 Tax=Fasciolopsis buskii TaxID=27845 RepID=A0A8E0RPV3_9TREM|nr:Nudix hydrolase 20 chloroplastic [Fasciolopsis buski]
MVQPDTGERCITLHPSLNTFDARSSAIGDVMLDLRSKKTFKALDGWRNEDYGVYIGDRQQPLLRLERSASSLLGVVRYGVHVNGYFINCSSELNGINNSKANGSSMGNSKSQPSPICKVSAGARLLGEYDPSTVMMWLGVRSLNKPTWPGMLDNIAAGGLTFGLDALSCAHKECQEEASVPEELLSTLTSVSRLSYVFEDERGVCPQVEYCFDLELPCDFVPVGADGEVDSFQLVSIAEVKELIFSDRFKANSALVILDFLYRHKFIDPLSDPRHAEIQSLMHMKFEFD